jgi:Terminase small subunit
MIDDMAFRNMSPNTQKSYAGDRARALLASNEVRMALTPKREAFCCAFINLNVAAQAYTESHDASRMAPATIRKRAAELMKHPAVNARIAELRAAAAKAAVLDRASVLRDLDRVKRMAMGELPVRKLITVGRGKDAKPIEVETPMVDLSAACRALELIGKSDEVALFVERHEHTGRGGGPIVTQVEPLGDIERARRIVFILREAEMKMSEKTELAP